MESSSARKPQRLPELDQLEQTVRRLLEAHESLRRRAETAEQRVRELERAVQDVAAGRIDPVAMAEEGRRLETENQVLRTRLEAARETAQRIAGRLQFVEEEH